MGLVVAVCEYAGTLARVADPDFAPLHPGYEVRLIKLAALHQ